MRITRSQQWHEQAQVDTSQPQFTWPTVAFTVHDGSGKPDSVYEFERTVVEYYRHSRQDFQAWLRSWHYENTGRKATHLRFGGWLMAFDYDRFALDHFAIATLDKQLDSLPLLEALKTAEHYLSFFDDEHTSAYIDHLREVAGDLRAKVALDRRERLLVLSREGQERLAEVLKDPGKPTKAMKELMELPDLPPTPRRM